MTAEYRALLASDADRTTFDESLALARLVGPHLQDHNFYIEHRHHSVWWNKIREVGRPHGRRRRAGRARRPLLPQSLGGRGGSLRRRLRMGLLGLDAPRALAGDHRAAQGDRRRRCARGSPSPPSGPCPPTSAAWSGRSSGSRPRRSSAGWATTTADPDELRGVPRRRGRSRAAYASSSPPRRSPRWEPARSSSAPPPRRRGRRCSPTSAPSSPMSAGPCRTPRSSVASTGFPPSSARATPRAASRTGDLVRVDGAAGTVTILDRARADLIRAWHTSSTWRPPRPQPVEPRRRQGGRPRAAPRRSRSTCRPGSSSPPTPTAAGCATTASRRRSPAGGGRGRLRRAGRRVEGDRCALRRSRTRERRHRPRLRGLSATAPTSPVAVRSSATAEDLSDASFAGQQETYLSVIGREAVRRDIVRCWASLYSPQAIEYRRRLAIAADGVAMAVVVQRLVAGRGCRRAVHDRPAHGRPVADHDRGAPSASACRSSAARSRPTATASTRSRSRCARARSRTRRFADRFDPATGTIRRMRARRRGRRPRRA